MVCVVCGACVCVCVGVCACMHVCVMHDVTAQDPKLLVRLKVWRGVCLDVLCVCMCVRACDA